MAGIKKIKKTTVKSWIEQFDPSQESIAFECNNAFVVKITCKLCTKFKDQLKYVRNFSTSFIDGITGAALKKDNVSKHLTTQMHIKATNLEHSPTAEKLYETSPTEKAFTTTFTVQKDQLSRLVNLVYYLCYGEHSFKQIEALVTLEQKNGIDLGTAYHNRIACKNFTMIIGQLLERQVLDKIKMSQYFTILIDETTDISVTEKELIYLMTITPKGTTEMHFFR